MTRLFRSITHAFGPNRVLDKRIMLLIAVFQIGLAIFIWSIYSSPILPRPWDLWPAFQRLLTQGLIREIMVSFGTLVKALAITSAFTFVLAISTTFPFMRPGVRFASALRFMSFAGLTFVFTILTGGGHWLKIWLLVFATGTYMLTSKAAIVANIPSSAYDHARTLGMSELRVTWEVMILGMMDQFIEAVRQNAAMVWMLLPVVERMVMSEGGFGSLLFKQERHFDMAEVFVIQITVFVIAIAQDYVFGVIKFWLCPHAKLNVGGHR